MTVFFELAFSWCVEFLLYMTLALNWEKFEPFWCNDFAVDGLRAYYLILDTGMGSIGIDCGEPFMAKVEFLEEPIKGRNQLKNESSAVEISPKEQGFVHQISISDEQSELSSKVSDKENSSTSSPCRASDLSKLEAIESPLVTVGDAPVKLSKSIPKLNIAILVVGTRGDVQPFLALAKRLQELGHRVRLATHINFSDFVKSAGVEFYPLGGDSRLLARYMVENKALIPSSLEAISTQRKQVKAIIESLLPACMEPDIETGAAFRAQAIIANPPAYGQAHVAEGLSIPLHIFFTLPWTPTSEFPHPFVPGFVTQFTGNWLSYKMFDLFIWCATRNYINNLRKRKLKLAPIPFFSMYHGSTSHFPTSYMWNPHMMAKPKDWGPLVDIIGYCFLNLGSKYQPREEFVQWIQKGPKPIYVGFGSMPLENPGEITRITIEALKETGQRGILGRGCGDLGILSDAPENIFLLENCPHDWLFPQCSAVVHHGGAGTTSAGLKAGCPTTVVPFVGDQFLWASLIYEKGLGPKPIPIYQLSVEALSNAMRFMLQPEVKSRATEIAKLIENEDGVTAAVDAFHRHLPLKLPLPVQPSSKDDGPDLLQLFFTTIGNLCCLACS